MTRAGPKFLFKDPVLHELANLDKSYHLQNVTTDCGHNVFITTDWFLSDGIKSGLNNKAEMQFEVKQSVRDVLNVIETEAVRQLKIPQDVLRQNGIQGEVPLNSVYRLLNQSEYLFARLERECPIFDKNGRNILKRDQTGFGEYRVLLHVKGIYIGEHSRDGKLASLQMRIAQIQFKEVNLLCLLDPLPGLCRNPTLLEANSMPLPLASSTPVKAVPNAPRKAPRSRPRPTLQRQNAMTDSQVMNETLDSATAEFMASFNA